MSSFSYLSGRAQMKRCGHGVHFADYSGFFTLSAWQTLGEQVESRRKQSLVSVDRFYSAVHDTSDLLDDLDFGYMSGAAPGMWIVSREQYCTALALSRRLADMGVTRTVFLRDFEPMALDLASSLCSVSY